MVIVVIIQFFSIQPQFPSSSSVGKYHKPMLLPVLPKIVFRKRQRLLMLPSMILLEIGKNHSPRGPFVPQIVIIHTFYGTWKSQSLLSMWFSIIVPGNGVCQYPSFSFRFFSSSFGVRWVVSMPLGRSVWVWVEWVGSVKIPEDTSVVVVEIVQESVCILGALGVGGCARTGVSS